MRGGSLSVIIAIGAIVVSLAAVAYGIERVGRSSPIVLEETSFVVTGSIAPSPSGTPEMAEPSKTVVKLRSAEPILAASSSVPGWRPVQASPPGNQTASASPSPAENQTMSASPSPAGALTTVSPSPVGTQTTTASPSRPSAGSASRVSE